MKKLMGYERVRIYGKDVRTWTKTVTIFDGYEREIVTQFETEYREYSVADGSLVGTGTEDFSQERFSQALTCRCVWTWDGVSYNKGGMRKFDYHGNVRTRKEDVALLKILIKNKYNAALVQLR